MDKQITRLATLGVDRVLLFGEWWPLIKGHAYQVKRRKVYKKHWLEKGRRIGNTVHASKATKYVGGEVVDMGEVG